MDPFSTVAGAFSVISLAIQLVDKFQEIRDFWRSIEDAPADVCDLVNELDCVLGIIQGVREMDATSASSSNEPLPQALLACRMHVSKLSACVHDLKSGFDRGKAVRAWTSLRFAFRRERIRTSHEALERVKISLVLALMNSHEYVNSQPAQSKRRTYLLIGKQIDKHVFRIGDLLRKI